MYKNFSPEAFEITGRQSELIELTLTHRFKGLNLDLVAFQHQVETHGLDHASRFLKSAPVKLGPFELPIDWTNDQPLYRASLEKHRCLLETAKEIGCTSCKITIPPYSDGRPYHENFEFCRARLSELAEALQEYGLKLGITFVAPAHHRAGHQYPFVSAPDALVTLLKTTDSENLGIVVDVWHWEVAGGNPELLRGLDPAKIIEVCLADAPADADPEQITESDRLIPGVTGPTTALAYLNVLKELGYRGPVTPTPSASQLEGLRREETVEQVANATELLLANVGKPIEEALQAFESSEEAHDESMETADSTQG